MLKMDYPQRAIGGFSPGNHVTSGGEMVHHFGCRFGNHLIKSKTVLFGVAAAALLAACGSTSSAVSAGSSTTAAKASAGSTKSPVVFHAVLSETGAGSFLGTREGKSLQALALSVNASGGIDGHPVQMDIVDNRTSPSFAVSTVTSWIGQGVQFVLNGSQVATDVAVDALATPNGPFIYDLSPGVHPKPGSMVFSAGVSTQAQVATLLTYLKAKGLVNVAALTSSDASGTDGLNQLKTALATPQFSSMKLVANETFDPTAVSVTSQLSVIKSANPQAIVVWTIGTPFGTVLNGMSSLGMLSVPVATSSGNDPYSELNHFKAVLPVTLLENVAPLNLQPNYLPAGAVKDAVSTFRQQITTIGGHPSDAWGLSWDAAGLLIGALKKLGINATAKQILTYMESIKNVAGVFGEYNMSTTDHRGTTLSSVYVAKWNGSDFVPVSNPGGTPLAAG